jgi:hypothetical protein
MTSTKISQAPRTLITLPEEIRRIILRYCQPTEEECKIEICSNWLYRIALNDPGNPPLFQNHSRALLLVNWQLHDEVLRLPQPKWTLRCFCHRCLSWSLQALHPSQLRQIQAMHLHCQTPYPASWPVPEPSQPFEGSQCEKVLLEHFENVTRMKNQVTPLDGKAWTVIWKIGKSGGSRTKRLSDCFLRRE